MAFLIFLSFLPGLYGAWNAGNPKTAQNLLKNAQNCPKPPATEGGSAWKSLMYAAVDLSPTVRTQETGNRSSLYGAGKNI